MENIFLWIFADICKPMLQAKRLLAVVVGSHDTQQHELSLKEGDKVSEQHYNDGDGVNVSDGGGGGGDDQIGDKTLYFIETRSPAAQNPPFEDYPKQR